MICKHFLILWIVFSFSWQCPVKHESFLIFFQQKGNFIEASGPWGAGREATLWPRRWWRGLIYPSSWSTGYWCGHTSCSIGQCVDAGVHNTCSCNTWGRWSQRSRTSEQAGRGRAPWCHPADKAPSTGKTLTFSVVSLGPTSRVLILSARVFTQIHISPSAGEAAWPPH